MPIYEYTCQTCDHTFSKRRSMSEADAPLACPVCGSEQTHRELSLFATVGADRSRAVSSVGGRSGCAGCTASSCSTCGS
ncbi:MAG: FmdB family zinc ribbon protein [Anaerolineae bacterium]